MTSDALRLLHRAIGLAVVAYDGREVGRVDDIFFSPITSHAEWVAVRRSPLHRRVTPILLHDTTVDDTRLRIMHSFLDIRDAPSFRAHTSLTVADERRLREYWQGRPLYPLS